MESNALLPLPQNVVSESEYRYRQLVQALPAAVYTCDAQGTILLYNKAAALLWGREPVIGKDLWCGSWRIFRPDGTPLPLDTCPMAIALKEGRPVYGEEIIIERPDGVRRNVLPHPRPIFDGAGKVVQAVNMLVDITEFKKQEQAVRDSEEMFRTMAEQAPVIIWMSDEQANFSYLNSKWTSITGRPIEEGFGNGWINFIHPDDRETVINEWRNGPPEKKLYNFKFRYLNTSNDYNIFRVSGTPRYNTAGKFSGYIGVMQDITLQEAMNSYLEKKVEERTRELKKSNSELEKSNGELEGFAYVASHDLQEPLRKIQSFAELLERNLRDEDKMNYYLKKITDSSGRMMVLIKELLYFSRLSKSGNVFIKVDLNNIVQNVKDEFELVIRDQKATIEITGDLPVIEGIPIYLNQLFNNLIGNSLKFHSNNIKPVISINARRMTKPELAAHPALSPELEYFDIEFIDNGIGFSPEYSEQIFTIFQRLNNSHEYVGSGIGLAICKKIVSNHSGEIYAISSENKGATFHVILPETQNAVA